jgi:hypothetical protein
MQQVQPMETVLSLCIGALLGWGTSWFFYRRAKHDSEQSYQQVVQSLDALTAAIERGGATVVRNPLTNLPTGVILGELNATMPSPTMQVSATVTNPDEGPSHT